MAKQILIGSAESASPGFTNEDRLFGTEILCGTSGVATEITYRAIGVQRDGVGRGTLYESLSGDLLADTGVQSVTSGVDFVEEFGTPVAVVASSTYFPAVVANATSDNKNIFAHMFNGNGAIEDPSTYREYTMAPGDTLPDPYSGTYPGSSFYFGGYVSGYPVPSITSIDGDNEIDDSQTGVALVGANLVDSDGDPELHLCDSADYGSATINVTQTITASDDNSITFNVVKGGLSAGTVYAYVVTALGQVSPAHAITLVAGASTNACSVSATSAASTWNVSAVQQNAILLAAESAASLWNIVASNQETNSCSVAAVSAASSWGVQAELNNSAEIAAYSAPSLWQTLLNQINAANVDFQSAAANWAATIIQQNPASVDGLSAGSLWLIETDGSAVNICFVAAESAASLWSAEAGQLNPASIAWQSAASGFDVIIDLQNPAAVEAQSAAGLWEMAAQLVNNAQINGVSAAALWLVELTEQEVNLCSVQAQSPASLWSAAAEQTNSASVNFEAAGSLWNMTILSEADLVGFKAVNRTTLNLNRVRLTFKMKTK